MTSDELAAEIAEAVAATTKRVLGTGKEQYDDGTGTQKFEKLSVDELFQWTLEELDDLMVYNVMLRIRLRRVLAAQQWLAKLEKQNVHYTVPNTASSWQTAITYNHCPCRACTEGRERKNQK